MEAPEVSEFELSNDCNVPRTSFRFFCVEKSPSSRSCFNWDDCEGLNLYLSKIEMVGFVWLTFVEPRAVGTGGDVRVVNSCLTGCL